MSRLQAGPLLQFAGCSPGDWQYVRFVDFQQSASLGVVALTVGLFARAKFRRRKFQLGRDTHCGCGTASEGGSAAKSSIVYRARKGERPQIIVKMR